MLDQRLLRSHPDQIVSQLARRGLAVDLIVGTLLDPSDVQRAVEGSSAVVHLGARPSVPHSLQDPVATHEASAQPAP